MKAIPLTQGKVAIVDDEDYQRISAKKWCAMRVKTGWYAVRSITISGHGADRVWKHILMHREILGVDCEVDHENRDGLDNRKSNLRPATHAQNQQNCAGRPRRGRTSSFKGVSWHKRSKLWRATIVVNKRQKSLGYFSEESAAASAYDQAATKYFGKFARPNAKRI